MVDGPGGEAAHLGQRAHQNPHRHRRPEGAEDELVPHETLVPAELAPARQQVRMPDGFVLARETQQPLLHPPGERTLGRLVGIGHEQRDRLGQVTRRAAALLEQPLTDAGRLHGPRAQAGGTHHPPGSSAAQQIDGPRRVARRDGSKIGQQGSQLCVGLGGLLQRAAESRERPHAAG